MTIYGNGRWKMDTNDFRKFRDEKNVIHFLDPIINTTDQLNFNGG